MKTQTNLSQKKSLLNRLIFGGNPIKDKGSLLSRRFRQIVKAPQTGPPMERMVLTNEGVDRNRLKKG